MDRFLLAVIPAFGGKGYAHRSRSDPLHNFRLRPGSRSRLRRGSTKVAVDGAWIGANHHNSYLSFAVDPGEHHLCANWQSHIGRMSRVVGLSHFTAEAGKVYFFRTRTIGANGPTFFDVEPIDSDQGRLFIASILMSVSHPKKQD
jgi:hypothetical protein